jgi:hypothetical protein
MGKFLFLNYHQGVFLSRDGFWVFGNWEIRIFGHIFSLDCAKYAFWTKRKEGTVVWLPLV